MQLAVSFFVIVVKDNARHIAGLCHSNRRSLCTPITGGSCVLWSVFFHSLALGLKVGGHFKRAWR